MDRETLALAAILLGGIGGIQIWVVAGLTAGLGPLAIAIWLIAAGIMAMAAMCQLRCAGFHPRPAVVCTYVHSAYGHFYAFMTGWTGLWAESMVLAIFAIGIVDFVGAFVQLPFAVSAGLKAAYIATIAVLTALGGGKVPRAWQLVRLAMLFGFLATAAAFIIINPARLALATTAGWAAFLPALAVAIWAFSGFEAIVLPTGTERGRQVRAAAIAFGIATAIYIAFDTLIVAALGQPAAGLPVPAAAATISTGLGIGVAGIALVVAAAATAFIGPGTARVPQVNYIATSMVADGMLPRSVAACKHREVLLVPLAAQAVIAFIVSLSGDILDLIFFSFVMMAVALIAMCIAYNRLRRYYMRRPYEKLAPDYGILLVVAVLLVTLSQVPATALLIALIVLLMGIPFYIHLAPKTEDAAMKEHLMSETYSWFAYEVASNRYLGALLAQFGKRERVSG